MPDVLKNGVTENETRVDATDEELARRALEDEGCYALIMERYGKRLVRYVLRLGRFSEEDAKDVVQDVFIKAYQNLNGFDPDLKFSSWIYRIAHNETISKIRRQKARPQAVDAESEELFEKIASELDTEHELHVKLVGEQVRALLGTLDRKYREVLVLRFLEEKDYKEISDILKKPIGTVSVLLNRAKVKLRKAAEQRGAAAFMP